MIVFFVKKIFLEINIIMLNNFIKKRQTFSSNSNSKFFNPQYFYINQAFFIPKFLSRIVGAVFDKNKKIIKGWNFNDHFSDWSFKKILSFSLFNYDIFISIK